MILMLGRCSILRGGLAGIYSDLRHVIQDCSNITFGEDPWTRGSEESVTPTLRPLTPFGCSWRKRPESAEAVATNMETARRAEPIACGNTLVWETKREIKEERAFRESIIQIAEIAFATTPFKFRCCVPTPFETNAVVFRRACHVKICD